MNAASTLYQQGPPECAGQAWAPGARTRPLGPVFPRRSSHAPHPWVGWGKLSPDKTGVPWLAGLGVLGQLDGGRGSGGQVPDEGLGRQVGKHPEEPVALPDLLLGGRGEEVP